MTRIEATAGWVFTCLGIILLSLSTLLVSAATFAGSGADFDAPFSAPYSSRSADYPACVQSCCNDRCNSAQPCTDDCLQEAAGLQKKVCNGYVGMGKYADCSNKGSTCFLDPDDLLCTGDCNSKLLKPCTDCVCQPGGLLLQCKCDIKK